METKKLKKEIYKEMRALFEKVIIVSCAGSLALLIIFMSIVNIFSNNLTDGQYFGLALFCFPVLVLIFVVLVIRFANKSIKTKLNDIIEK